MNPGESYTATVILRNEGNEQWNAANNFKLGQNENIDNTIFGTGRFSIDDLTNEIPEYGGIFRGRTITYNIDIVAPTSVGVYSTNWQMLQEGNTWFGDTLEVTIAVGGASITNTKSADFNIFPNPAKTFILIEHNNKKEENIKIFDITGKYVKELNINSEKLKIDISDLEKGIYFIKIGNTTKKFIKD